MIGFWVVGALAVLLVLGLMFRPFLMKPVSDQVSRSQLNAAIYRDQVARLDRDRAENVLAEADYEQARAELQRRVIDDTSEADNTSTLQAPSKTMLAIGLVLPMAAFGLYLALGSPATVETNGPQHSATAQDMNRLVVGLAKKLESDPGNLEGWAMLGRSYKMMGRYTEAEQAFERAGAFVDADAQLLAMYADLVATNAKGNFAGKPIQLIQRALKVDPDNAMALWLAGTAEFRGNQFESAIRIWERLISRVEPNSEDAQMLQQSIDTAYEALGKTAPQAKVRAPTPASNNGANAAKSTAGASVSGQVDLDPALKTRAAASDTVMVIARVPGTRMPVAVVRANASELPLKFMLDDSLAMSPQARISTATQVEVEARISKSGMAQPESGDLISAVQTVKVGTNGLKLQVNKVRP